MSDNQVTEPIETACFCKHGNLGQHESDCPKCPLHFTRGELNALQRERDQLRADLAKAREERDDYDKARQEIAALSVRSMSALADDIKIIEEITKHVGVTSIREAFDVLIRTKGQDEEKIESMFNKIKELGKQNATLTAELEQARKERDVLLGRAQLLQRQNEHWVEKLREQEPTMTLLKTEASHLRELINNAPHTNMCVINGPNCSCWKSAARLAAKTEK